MIQSFQQKKLLIVSFILLFAGMVTVTLAIPQKVEAVDPDDWQAGRIIDDYLFMNSSAATTADIQATIEAITPVCDTWGTGVSPYYAPDYDGNGIVTRAEYGQFRGNPAPFTCLKNYRENPFTGESNYGGGGTPAGSRTAAQLIVDAGNRYDINPQVLLVMLRKESAIVDDDWPFLSQYQYAMGANCPDGPGGANCDPDYAGFAIQIDQSAALFRYYLDNMDQSWWPYKNIGVHNILWNTIYNYYTNGSGQSVQCGGGAVNITSRATAALYTYTPYQPNNASLNAYPGAVNSGGSFAVNCASYGNRNFWYFFQNMFGSTEAVDENVRLTTHLDVSDLNPTAGDTVTASFTIVNNNTFDVTIEQLRVNGRDPEDKEATFAPALDVTIPAGDSYTYSRTRTVNKSGQYRFWIASRHLNAWSLTWPVSNQNNLVRERFATAETNPFMITDLNINETTVATGQNVTASFDIQNNSNFDYVLPQLKVAGRDSSGKVFNFPTDVNAVIPANSTYTYSKDRAFEFLGDYNLWVTSFNGHFWRNNLPASLNGSIERTALISVVEESSAVTVSSSLSLDESAPYTNNNVTASFEIANSADYPIAIGNLKIAGRNTNGAVFNFEEKAGVVVPANGTYTYSSTRSFPNAGEYNFWIINHHAGHWKTDYPASANGSVVRIAELTAQNNPVRITTLELSPAEPLVFEDATATFTIQNNSNEDVVIDNLKVAGRDEDSSVVNFDTHTNFTVPANGTYEYSATRSFSSEGDHNFWITSYMGGKWNNNYPAPASNSLNASLSTEVVRDVLLDTSLSLSDSTPGVGEDVTATFNLVNTSDEAVTIEHLLVAGRSPTNTKTNFTAFDNLVIPANSIYSYNETRTFTETGNHNFWITSLFRGGWNNSYPPNSTTGLLRTGSITVEP